MAWIPETANTNTAESNKLEVKAVENVSFTLKEGETLLLLGPNGSGKTTLLKVIAGIHGEYTGEIRVFNKKPEEARDIISYVPQTFKINESVPLKVLDVVLMGVLYNKRKIHVNPAREEVEKACKALETVELLDAAEKVFSELSGGQKQRVLIARALASDPKLMLLDEPISHLDPHARNEVVEALLTVKKKRRVSMVIATHDTNPLIELGDKVLLLNRKVVAFGTPEEALSDEVIMKVYGKTSRTVRIKGKVYCIIGDVHVHKHT